MPKLQFSLVALLGLVSFVAVGFAALCRPNEWWTSGLMTAAVAAVVVAALAAGFRRGRSQAFAGGFALVGGAYLLLVFGPGFAERVGPWLLSSRALALATAKWQPQADATNAATRGLTVLRANSVAIGQGVVDFDNDGFLDLLVVNNSPSVAGGPGVWSFHYIGQSLWTLLFALLGGLVARRWAAAQSAPH